MRYLPGSIPPPGSARPRRGLLSLLAAATLLATFGSVRSSAEDYSQARGAPSKPSNALAQQSADVQSHASHTASKRAGSRRATRLRATTGCNSKREPFVTFRWIPARLRGRAQRVDYTEFFGGFSSGKFHQSRKLAPGKRRWRTGKIETGFDYEWRVMTRHAHRWVRSAVRSFDGPVCVQNSAASLPGWHLKPDVAEYLGEKMSARLHSARGDKRAEALCRRDKYCRNGGMAFGHQPRRD